MQGGVATVVGSARSRPRRVGEAGARVRAPGPPGRGCPSDQLVDGWSFDPATLAVTPGPRAEAVAWDGVATANAPGDWRVDGDAPAQEERFGWVVARGAAGYGTHPGREVPVQQDLLGALDATATDRRGPAQEAVLRALYDHVGATGGLLGAGGRLVRDPDDVDRIRVVAGPGGPDQAAVIVESAALTARDTSPEPSNVGVEGLAAAGLAGLRLHLLAGDLAYDTAARAVVRSR
ncbi:MAG: hypothetical protein R3F59_23320 [Myxococcota bacterium]